MEATDQMSREEIVKLATKNPMAYKRWRARTDFKFFLSYFWDQYSADELQWNWHLDVICEELQKIAERVALGLPKEYDLIINVPPGSTKTASVSVMFPAWVWTNWFWMRFITASYTSTLSLESAEYSRDVVKSPKYRQLFPEIEIKRDKDTKSNFRIVKRQKDSEGYDKTIFGGYRFSTSIGGTLMGFHGNIQILDDPIDPQRASVESLLNNANDWVGNTLATRKAHKDVTPLILIQQRLHQNDPTGNMLENRPNSIKHICLPGEIKNYRDQVRPKEMIKYYKNGLLDPQRLSWKVLKELEEQLGQYGYAGQIGQRPVPPGGGMFQADSFQYVAEIPNKSQIIKTVRYWDKAGTSGGGAYTVGVKMHQLRGGKWLIEDIKRGQWSTNMREKIIRSTAEADGQNVEVWVEQEPGSGGQESAENTITNLAGFSVHADQVRGNKETRADPFSVQVNNGNILLLTAQWNHTFVEECRFFPYSTYKDQVDAASGAFSKLAKNRQVIIW